MSALSRWKWLCSIRIEHGYFADRICPALSLKPSASSASLLSQYGLLFRPVPSGGELWYESRAGVEPVLGISPELTLEFDLVMTNTDFSLYTELDGGDPAAVRVFSNLSATPANPDQERSFVPPDGRDIALRSHSYSYSSQRPLKGKIVTIQTSWTARTVYQAAAPDSPFETITADLSELPPGVYALLLDEKRLETFFLQDNMAPQSFGKVTIAPASKALPATERLVLNRQTIQPQTFLMAFSAKRAIWSYRMASDPGLSAEITAKGRRAAFSGPEKITRNGTPYWEFRSSDPLPLRQSAREDDVFRLRRRNMIGATDTVILPIPSPQSVELQDTATGPVSVATLYVYS